MLIIVYLWKFQYHDAIYACTKLYLATFTYTHEITYMFEYVHNMDIRMHT